MKFLSNADLVWGWGIFTRKVVITFWLAIGAVLMTYLSGFVRLGVAPRLGRPPRLRIVATAGCALLLVWLATGLSRRRLGELEAFLPPADAAALNGVELAWLMNDYDGAIAEAKPQDRPILVDFTGYTCTNCRWMEANMFPRPEVTRELARYVRVRLYTDGRGDYYRWFQELERQSLRHCGIAVLRRANAVRSAGGSLWRSNAQFKRVP